ncbi:MAG: 50S ribosomal protein L19 [Candidatus Omnitrophica bacterium]|nr:50S ribosomal protein L19 [Candidatus Omnitrophota bacterium]
MDKLRQFETELLKKSVKEYPEFNAGDVIKVYYKIKEKDKVRLHPIEGIVLKIQGQMHRKAFTLRRIAYGQAYEVTLPYYSPNIDKIELVKESRRRPRRGRLYYLRSRVGKKAVLA